MHVPKLEGEKKGKLEGLMRGLIEGIEGMLEIKFGDIPTDFKNKLQTISELSKLQEIKDYIKFASDYEQIQKML